MQIDLTFTRAGLTISHNQSSVKLDDTLVRGFIFAHPDDVVETVLCDFILGARTTTAVARCIVERCASIRAARTKFSGTPHPAFDDDLQFSSGFVEEDSGRSRPLEDVDAEEDEGKPEHEQTPEHGIACCRDQNEEREEHHRAGNKEKLPREKAGSSSIDEHFVKAPVSAGTNLKFLGWRVCQ